MSNGAQNQLPEPHWERLRNDMCQDILSEIEDYCLIFGTSALPGLRDRIAQATRDWTASPQLEGDPHTHTSGMLSGEGVTPMPVSPRDIEESDSTSFRLALESLQTKIDVSLMQARFLGPGEFRVELAEHMTDGLRAQMKRNYMRYWKNVRFAQEQGIWVIYIMAYEPQQEG